MEEKWWSKFQTKSTEGSKPDDEYLSMDDIKEVVSEEIQERLDEALIAGKRASEDLKQWANETIEQTPEVKEVLENAKEKVDDVKTWIHDTTQKPEVQDAWKVVTDSANKAAESSAKAFEDVKTWTAQTWEKPEVQKTVAQMKDMADDAIDAGVDVIHQGVEWANQLASQPQVQSTVHVVKEKANDVAEDVQRGFEKVMQDPSVQSAKENFNEWSTKTSKTLKDGYEQLKSEQEWKEEMKEFGRVAAQLGKQGARVVVSTVEEIRTNEKVISAVEKGKEISLDLLDKGIGVVHSLAARYREKARADEDYQEFKRQKEAMRQERERDSNTQEDE